jgi:hypothetical protein
MVQEISKVSTLLNQIRKNSDNIVSIVDQISSAVLVQEPPTHPDEILDAQVRSSFSVSFAS